MDRHDVLTQLGAEVIDIPLPGERDDSMKLWRVKFAFYRGRDDGRGIREEMYVFVLARNADEVDQVLKQSYNQPQMEFITEVQGPTILKNPSW